MTYPVPREIPATIPASALPAYQHLAGLPQGAGRHRIADQLPYRPRWELWYGEDRLIEIDQEWT